MSTAPSQGSVQLESDFAMASNVSHEASSHAWMWAAQQQQGALPLWPSYDTSEDSAANTRHRLHGQLVAATAGTASHRHVYQHAQGGGVFVDEHTPPDNIWKSPLGGSSTAANEASYYYQSSSDALQRSLRLEDPLNFDLQSTGLVAVSDNRRVAPGLSGQQACFNQTQEVAALVRHTANLNVSYPGSLGEPSQQSVGGGAVSYGRHHAAAAALTFSLALGGGVLADPRSQQSRGEESPLVGVYTGMHTSPVFSH